MLCRIRYCFGYCECRAYIICLFGLSIANCLQVWTRCSKTVRSLSASQWATTLLIGARLSAIILHSLELKLAIDDQRHPFYASDLWTNVLHLASDNEWIMIEQLVSLLADLKSSIRHHQSTKILSCPTVWCLRLHALHTRCRGMMDVGHVVTLPVHVVVLIQVAYVPRRVDAYFRRCANCETDVAVQMVHVSHA